MEKIEYFVELKDGWLWWIFFGVMDGCWRGVGGREKGRGAGLVAATATATATAGRNSKNYHSYDYHYYQSA